MGTGRVETAASLRPPLCTAGTSPSQRLHGLGPGFGNNTNGTFAGLAFMTLGHEGVIPSPVPTAYREGGPADRAALTLTQEDWGRPLSGDTHPFSAGKAHTPVRPPVRSVAC